MRRDVRSFGAAKFQPNHVDAITPRLEYGEPVDGLLVTARRPDYSG